MKYIRFILLLCAVHTGIAAMAQPDTQAQHMTINQVDVRGYRYGLWLLQSPARMGEPAYSTWGRYIEGRKNGMWYKTDENGEITAIENFKNNVMDGEVKYFDHGHITAVGHYRGLNPDNAFDTIMVIDPVTRQEFLRSISTERGSLRHGMWRFYDPNTGRLLREEEYQVDSLIYKKEFILTSADSAYYKRYEQNLPHNKHVKPGKSVSNLK